MRIEIYRNRFEDIWGGILNIFLKTKYNNYCADEKPWR